MRKVLGKSPSGQCVEICVLFMAEFLATTFLIFIGCFSCESRVIGDNGFPFPQTPSIVWGFGVCLCMSMFGHISGAHMNPSVTIGACIMNKLKWKLMPVYFLAEVTGAFAGYGLVILVLPSKFNPTDSMLCCTVPHPELSAPKAFLLEFLLTSFLMFTLCAIWDKRGENYSYCVNVMFGMLLSAVFIFGGPWTGASINSFRSLAPAVYNNQWKDHWIYWTAPNLAAVVIPCFYKFFFLWFDNRDDNGEKIITKDTQETS